MIIKKIRMVNVAVRIPDQVRVHARKLASDHGVSESVIYRSILSDFFSVERLHFVNELVDNEKKT